jgi:hypothetical protein
MHGEWDDGQEIGGGWRDWEPHHGPELRLLSIVSLVCSTCSFGTLALPPWSFALVPFAVGGLLLGLVSSGLAWAELVRVADGLMAPDGASPLRAARSWGAGAAYLSLFSGFFTLLALLKALHLF